VGPGVVVHTAVTASAPERAAVVVWVAVVAEMALDFGFPGALDSPFR